MRGIRCYVHSSAIVSHSASLGNDVYIGPNVVIDGSVTVGDRCQIGPGSVIGGHGFGYDYSERDGWREKPHGFGVVLGDDVRVHSNVCIDRGSWRDTRIGKGTIVDNLVHIAHNVVTGHDCCIIAGAEVSGSVDLGDRVYIAPNACVRERLFIGGGSIIGLGAVVVKDVRPRTVMAGVPARELGPVTEWPPAPPEGR